jgi:PAS domain S-box-containing protein
MDETGEMQQSEELKRREDTSTSVALAELQRQASALTETLMTDSSAFGTLLTRSVSAVMVQFHSQLILAATPPMDALFGYVEGALFGKQLRELIPERFRKRHDEHFHRFCEDPKPRLMGVPGMDFIGVTRKGEEFRVVITLDPKVTQRVSVIIANVIGPI